MKYSDSEEFKKLRYDIAFLNHNSSVWKYDLEAIDTPVYDE